MANFDYFYEDQADLFTFFRIPKALVLDKRFRDVSLEAKVLYGLLLDRMSLSAKNEWFDDEKRVYIIFTIEEAMEQLGYARQKTVKLFEELEKMANLIERKRRGQGKPSIIYVKKFLATEKRDAISDRGSETERAKSPENMTPENQAVPDTDTEPKTEPETENQAKSGKSRAKSGENRAKSPESQAKMPDSAQKYEIQTSRSMKIILPEVRKSYPNDTDNSNTYFSNNRIVSYPYTEDTTVPTNNKSKDAIRYDAIRGAVTEEEYINAVEEVREQLDYDVLLESDSVPQDELDDIVSIIAEIYCSKNKTIRISGQEHTLGKVKKRLRSINSEHILYIFDCLESTTTDIKNIRKYLLASLYNAPVTMSSYYASRLRHDSYHSAFD